MLRNKAVKYAATLLGMLLLGGILQLAGQHSGKLIFPGIDQIVKRFFALLSEEKTWKMLLTTIIHLVQAIAVSTVLGILVGFFQGISPFFEYLMRPLLAALRSIPMIVLVIMIMVLNRYENVPVISTGLVLFPLIAEATAEGIRRIDPELIDVYRINGALSVRVFFLVYLPLISGYLRQSYINAAGTGVKVAVTSEYLVQSADSLGKAVFSSFYFSEYADIYAYALIMILLVIFLTEVPSLILRLVGKKEVTIR